MSRRPVTRAAPSEAVFAQRREEIPYQIYFEISNIGRNVESSKKRARWMFCFGDEGREHEVALVHSVMSGKKKTFFNGELVNEAQQVAKEWSFAWSFGPHLLRVGIDFDEYNLIIDGLPFKSFTRRDPYMVAQLEATKRDSMRSLRSDEERRFEKLGYSGGGNGRSRTAERRRPGGASKSSAGSRPGSSKDATNHRSGSEDRPPVDRVNSSQPARSLSTRQFKSPPNPSGPEDRRERSKSKKPREQSDDGARGGKGSPASGDILSADPSTLDVNPFNALVSETDFDPLVAKNIQAKGGEMNGAGNHHRGEPTNGVWPGAGGGEIARPEQQKADDVLRLGMQFKAMGVSQQFQRQPQPSQQQQQNQFQSSFNYTSYQQYDDSGFPQPVQQQRSYPPPLLQAEDTGPFGGAAQGAGPTFGDRTGDANSIFSGGYHAHGLQQQQQPHRAERQGVQGQGGTTASDAEDGKASSLDPWDLARSGMVNIDDITDTKHLPQVEVKPFTNDHRPLADLVREMPVKSKASVMMERPVPPPTHMAVAIVPFQSSDQQQPLPSQGGFPQGQNGNPFTQLALTQHGQPAQPIFYTKSNDPFQNM